MILNRELSAWIISITRLKALELAGLVTGFVGASAQFGHRETVRAPKAANLTQTISRTWRQ